MNITKGRWIVACDIRADLIAMHKAGLREAPEDHAGYSRTNDGGWIVACRDAETGIAEVRAQFAKQPKRGQAFSAPDPEGMANAFLIAAAPDLLAALIGMLHAGSALADRYAAAEAARAAIAKATTITHEGHAHPSNMGAIPND